MRGDLDRTPDDEPLVTITLPASALYALPVLIEALETAWLQAVRLGLIGPGARERS